MNNFPTPLLISLYVIVFLYGIVIGSFLNVVICRVPRKESLIKSRSHCEGCGYQLRWYDLIPLFSYIFLGGKCRKCKAIISIQHPLIEGLNGVLYLMIFAKFGLTVDCLLYCLLASALLAMSVIDFRTYEIPPGFPIFIAVLGGIHLTLDYTNWLEYLIGAVAVSGFMFLIIWFWPDAMGGGDMKLMAACGLLLGWKLVVVAFIFGCALGSVIHVARMIISKEDHVLALGPYLAAGVMLAVMWGNQFIGWYLNFIGLNV
ncbi:MAG: prepilin peptidase [Lachnospiraceae bacterium]|nr:prepilin peptidase [Lachnospiraceae bacterium]